MNIKEIKILLVDDEKDNPQTARRSLAEQEILKKLQEAEETVINDESWLSLEELKATLGIQAARILMLPIFQSRKYF